MVSTLKVEKATGWASLAGRPFALFPCSAMALATVTQGSGCLVGRNPICIYSCVGLDTVLNGQVEWLCCPPACSRPQAAFSTLGRVAGGAPLGAGSGWLWPGNSLTVWIVQNNLSFCTWGLTSDCWVSWELSRQDLSSLNMPLLAYLHGGRRV